MASTMPLPSISDAKMSFRDWLDANDIPLAFSFSHTVSLCRDLDCIGGRPLPTLPPVLFGMAKKPLGVMEYSTILVTKDELDDLASLFAALSIRFSKPLTTKVKNTLLLSNFESHHQDTTHLQNHKQFLRFPTSNPGLLPTTTLVLNSNRNVPKSLRNNSQAIVKNNASKKKSKSAQNTKKRPSKESNVTSQKLPACFSLLPIELRLMIWVFAHPEPRAVKVSISKHQKGRKENLYSGALIPNLLQVCRESREIALKWYKLSFGKRKTIYFDWSGDYLYAQCSECRGRLCYDRGAEKCGSMRLGNIERDSLKRLIWEFSGNSTSVEITALMQYPAVDQLKIIHWDKGLLFRHGAELSQFVEDKQKYLWQNNKSLLDFFKSSYFANDQDQHGQSIRNLKSVEHIALYPLNGLTDVLKDAEIRYMKQK